MHKIVLILISYLLILACINSILQDTADENSVIELNIPSGFPNLNYNVHKNKPTKYGVELGKKLFHEKKFSTNNSISCASCHNRTHAYADINRQARGIYGRIGLRNTPPIQNLAFMQAYNWDGHKRSLESQPLVPIITSEEMNSSILEVINKLDKVSAYRKLFKKAFGDNKITPERIYQSIAQYEYTLISAKSKYDRVIHHKNASFTESEAKGYKIFQHKCSSCHSSELFTDQSFRSIGFPLNTNTNEAGRGRVTGLSTDYMAFRVPSLRNVEYTVPYGSFGQFTTLRAVLDYLDDGVIDADNLDPILKNNGNRIPLSEQEKDDIIAFLKTLSDAEFVGKEESSTSFRR